MLVVICLIYHLSDLYYVTTIDNATGPPSYALLRSPSPYYPPILLHLSCPSHRRTDCAPDRSPFPNTSHSSFVRCSEKRRSSRATDEIIFSSLSSQSRLHCTLTLNKYTMRWQQALYQRVTIGEQMKNLIFQIVSLSFYGTLFARILHISHCLVGYSTWLETDYGSSIYSHSDCSNKSSIISD